MTTKAFLLTITVIFMGFFVAVAVTGESSEEPIMTVDDSPLYLSEAEEAKILITEFSDFQCPACLQVQPVIKQAIDDYGDKVTFEFKHFPLSSIHQNALAAHRVAEAAQQQGLFREVHDHLFDTQGDWSGVWDPLDRIYSGLEQSDVALDLEKLKADVVASATLDAINADIAEGKLDDIDSTPTLIIAGQKTLVGSYQDLAAQIEAALNE